MVCPKKETLHICNYVFRATVNFKVEHSMDNSVWATSLEAAFTGPFPPVHGCEETSFYPVQAAPISFRYIRFTALSYHQKGASLSFFQPRIIGQKFYFPLKTVYAILSTLSSRLQ